VFQRLKDRYTDWRIARHPIPDTLWRGALARHVYAQELPPAQQRKLRQLTTLFLLQKHFSSAHGLVISDAMRVRIAIKACIPILELGIDYCSNYSGLVLYPHDFRARDEHVDEAGVVHQEVRELCGQALSNGPMVLSWEAVQNDDDNDARDVVIHECAHKLDMLNGHADGFPPLHRDMSGTEWTSVFQAAYTQLCIKLDAGDEPPIDPYAAEDAAEFFAVTSETFFTRPDTIAEGLPEVYTQLKRFYRQDPHAVLTGAAA
jgi:Mlc titration factor MtfA (ptsG expression regulator)